MRLLMIGPPGAGKGTQAVRIAEQFKLVHISSGDLLRAHVKGETATGKQVQQYLASGDLVPDGIVMDILRKPVVEANNQGGYVLDGFPRTVEQAEIAYSVAQTLGVEVQVVVHLEVPRDELVRRLVERGAASGRSDDNLDVINHRLDVYDEKTLPMLNYYAAREKLINVNGARSVDEVTWSITVQLQRLAKALAGD
ncbi:adenylate kinase [Sporichthya sp.]|uniref:adenylate kinase n=1 Tax=Sporichthya sp. TaxID=65475 RepID=UPI0017AC848B|nr:adenylate kinase [Sporichthya sp.]MBA3745149.1 adenylate kinase [Sporichthya sp.]